MMNDLQLFLGIINFIILISLLRWATRRPLLEFFRERHQGLKESIDTLQKRRSAVCDLHLKRRRRLSNIDDEIAAAKKRMEEVGRKEREEMLRKAEEMARRIETDGKRQMEQETGRAQVEIRHRILERAFANVLHRFQKGIPSDHQRSITDLALKRLGELDRFGPLIASPHAAIGRGQRGKGTALQLDAKQKQANGEVR